MLRLDGIMAFLAVVEGGSFTSAAKSLGVSASFVSRKVADLETDLRTTLLNRTTRHVSLTDVGQQFHAQTLEAFQKIRAAETEILEQGKHVSGRIRVSAAGLYGERDVSASIARFGGKYPDVTIELVLTDRLVDLMGENFDLAIRHGRPGDDRLVARRVAQYRLRTCAAPSYLQRHGQPARLEDLRDHVRLGASGQIWRFRLRGIIHELPVGNQWHSNTGPSLVSAAQMGLGIIQLPEFYVRDAIAEKSLLPILESHEIKMMPTYIVYPAGNKLPYRVRALLDHLLDELHNS